MAPAIGHRPAKQHFGTDFTASVLLSSITSSVLVVAANQMVEHLPDLGTKIET